MPVWPSDLLPGVVTDLQRAGPLESGGGQAFAEQMAGFAAIGIDEVGATPPDGRPDVYIAELGEHVIPRL